MDSEDQRHLLQPVLELTKLKLLARVTESYDQLLKDLDTMLSSEYYNGFLDVVQVHTESSDIHKGAVQHSTSLMMNASMHANDSVFLPELFYRHSAAMTAVYCIAYLLVFAIGIVGNFFVIAVVFRSPRMRTVTNFFIVNLAVADILVIVFCLPATLMSNIFVRKYAV
ncbi:hypothetical protein HUJ04_011949 [Dendroctonus ponderosae]|nr:hypothetical protein HUJ04_011949 [Dendroctonus ponderosae]KAH1029068.1 hypothetical protein HUJ05_002367 [Dendroctonus ponderosae]